MGAECGKHGLWTGASCPGLLFAYGRELQLVIFRVPVQAPVQCCSEAGVGTLNSVCPSQGLRGEGGVPPPPVLSARVSYIKKWNDPRPPLNGFVARFGRQRPSNGAKKLSLGGLEVGFFVQNLKCSDYATDSLFTMFLSENTHRNHLNIIEKCAFHRLLNGIAFFPLYLCSKLQLLSIWEQSRPAKVPRKGGHG